MNDWKASYPRNLAAMHYTNDLTPASSSTGSAIPSATMWKYSPQTITSGSVSQTIVNFEYETHSGTEFTVDLAAGTITPSTGGVYEVIANVNWTTGEDGSGQYAMEVYQIDEADASVAIPIGVKEEFNGSNAGVSFQQLGVFRFNMNADNLFPFYIKVRHDADFDEPVSNVDAVYGRFALSLSVSKIS